MNIRQHELITWHTDPHIPYTSKLIIHQIETYFKKTVTSYIHNSSLGINKYIDMTQKYYQNVCVKKQSILIWLHDNYKWGSNFF